MDLRPPPGIGIIGTGSYVPAGIRGNDELGRLHAMSGERIEKLTGIRERRIAGPREAMSDLAYEAARQALTAAAVEPEDIGLVVLGSSTPDELGPASACRVQARLGAWRAVAMDVGGACAGFLYGLYVACAALAGGRSGHPARYALVIGAEVFSKFVDGRDRGTALLFGDGAGAVVLGPVADSRGLTYIHLGSDGRLADHVLIPAGGGRRPASAETLARGEHFIRMDRRPVRDFITDIYPRLLTRVRDAVGLGVSDLHLVIPHQANPQLISDLSEAAGLRPEQLWMTGSRYGNTGAASVPLTLHDALLAGRLTAGSQVVLTAFGAGVTWGAAHLRW